MTDHDSDKFHDRRSHQDDISEKIEEIERVSNAQTHQALVLTNGSDRQTSKRRLFLFVLLLLIAASIPIALFGWLELYNRVLETVPPEISINLEEVRGIGAAPITLKIDLSDTDTGLDEVVVRVEQRKGQAREVLRESLGGSKKRTVLYEFTGVNSQLEEGQVTISVKAFDRSFWSNSALKELILKVDYRKPKLEILTSQHNARIGGSQLLFYRAYDENLDKTGVKVGDKLFEGFKASGIDPAFQEDSLYVALYAVPLDYKPSNDSIRLLAIDAVGNSSTLSFYNKVLPRERAKLDIAVREPFLREQVTSLIDSYLPTLESLAREQNKEIRFSSEKGTEARLIEQFHLVNQELRAFSEDQLSSLLLGKYRYKREWQIEFLRNQGGSGQVFGDQLSFLYDGKKIGQTVSTGYEIKNSPTSPVLAANDGVVILADNLGIYGSVVVIDHGLGLVTLYGHLSSMKVTEGDRVLRSDIIGFMGSSGFSSYPNLYFETRLQNVTVDPREWWDPGWIRSHVEGKIAEVKKSLGLTHSRVIQ